MSLKLLAVNGSVTRHSRTGTLLRTVLDGAAKAHPEIETELLELAEYRLDFCDGRDPWAYAGDTAEVIRKVVEADALIVGTPVYRASFTGALKNLLDLIPNDALAGKAVGLVATGGSDHHLLALEYALRPVISSFGLTRCPAPCTRRTPTSTLARNWWTRRCAGAPRLGEETVELAYRLRAGSGQRLAGPPPPAIPRKALG